MNKLILTPSILTCDQTNVISAINIAKKEDIKYLHLDIMDGHFVPNISFGPQLVSDIRKQTNMMLDLHLMVLHPENFIEKFATAGSDIITIHIETSCNILEIIKKIKSFGIKAGIALNPETSVESVLRYTEIANLILVMSVQPGFGGQQFKQEALNKIKQLSKFRMQQNLNFRIEVDGGINLQNLNQIINAGADTIVAGTAFFKDPQHFCTRFSELI